MEDLLLKIRDAIVELEEEDSADAVREAIEAGVNPQDIILHGLQEGMAIIGDKFANREYFLPELIISAEIMKDLSAYLKPFLDAQEVEKVAKKKVLLGTVKDDIHDIGKNIVSLVLNANGFEVYDLGVDVPVEDFVTKAKEVDADLIGMSALLSTVIGKTGEFIKTFKEEGLRAKYMVGGAAFTEKSAEMVGADGYSQDAWEALDLAKSLTA